MEKSVSVTDCNSVKADSTPVKYFFLYLLLLSPLTIGVTRFDSDGSVSVPVELS